MCSCFGISDIRKEIVGYGGITAYQLVHSLSKTCDARSWLVDAVLKHPIKVEQVCELIPYKVPQNRVARLFDAASNDLLFIDSDTFQKVIVLQLAFSRKSLVSSI